MKKVLSGLLIISFVATAALAQDRTASFDAKRMIQRVKRLSADDFEGRGPGTDGGKRAAQYIADQLKAGGVKPANKGSYFQNVTLAGLKADPNTKLAVAGKNGVTDYKFGDDFVATTGAQAERILVESEIVFVGYGIDAPLYKWNDYKGGEADYKGKILMILVNDPPASAGEPDLFGGKALTYFGRWTYKFEEAARRGAAGVILVHTTGSAGYGWNVVRTSNGNWRYEIARKAGDKSPYLQFKGWATEDAASRILGSAGFDLTKLSAAARTRDFKPVKTGVTAKLELNSQMKTFDSPNVAGIVDGTDSKLKSEFVIYSGHWDHLGIGEPNASGDKIYNGAYDNASGVAAILGIADVIAKLPKKERPKRSIMFFFPTAEEQGLLGAEYYSKHPLVPIDKTAANVNIDGVNFFGKVSDFMPLGAERSSMISVINEAAAERKLTVEADMQPEQGFFFRSDHFPFAKVGVPAVSLQHGDKFLKPLRAEAASFFNGYNSTHYHQVTDEFHDWWDVSAMVQESEFALAIGLKLANSPTMPRYNDTDEFSAADKKRFTK
ncbi:MAG TPA: M28 family peptidase [Pyrinomonadaceae bacterium]|nr:M28 family peptidase [Chloracidobacterium sp.]MBP9936685.1 M28 family peptidase [Pyrinomonadaceae bacterium]MBK7804038.1 M28 family peptidase [Chloracidobacterium sp.]MBK9768736.1 M28 family peptidase [Chloracidobacterium sp.]MBL0239415.1 M28 family peptidase [Chloracidobacterium sp.]